MDQPNLHQATPARRWSRHWLVRTFVISLIAISAFYAIERMLGERAWKAYQKKAIANGIQLRFDDYLLPPISDDENYAAAPVFQGICTEPDAAKTVEALFDLPTLQRKKSAKLKPDPLDLSDWQQTFFKAGWINQLGSDPAADVLVALERMEVSLTKVRQASGRPKARWPVKWEDSPVSVPPHYGVLQSMSRVLALRTRALLATNRPDEAIEELRHLFRIARSLKSEPTLLTELVRMALWQVALEVAEQGIAAGKWEAVHLDALETETGTENFLADLEFGFNSERGIANKMLDHLTTAKHRDFVAFYPAARSSPIKSVIWFVLPRGWIRHNQVEYNELLDADLGDIDSANELIDSRFSRAKATLMQRSSSSLDEVYHFLPRTLVSGLLEAATRAFDAHTRLRQFKILCALARYRADHGELPLSLEELVPAYAHTLPHDIMDGKPMRYRRTKEGGCILWSIGKNKTDDGGTEGKVRRRPQALDWIVELPPLPMR